MSIVCDISAAAREGCRAKRGLPILIRLRKRAHDSLVAANKPKAPSVFALGSPPEEDDLSHLISTAKLRRIGSSPPQQLKAAPGETTQRQPQPGESGISPHSQGSFATSTTLAEPHVYDDTNQYLVDPDQSRYAGMVPAPPDQMIPDAMWFNADLSPGVTLDLSAPYPWPEYDEGLMGGGGQEVMDMDMSMALGLGGSADMGMGTGWNQEDGGFGFDFEAFVNQVGVDGSFVGEEPGLQP